MRFFLRFFGSLKIAIVLLVGIAMVLAWGTIYETRFGTASVQRFVYQSWWFQGLLGFLAFNLALAAWSRFPWKRKHLPFLMAHLGIILILFGGILGGRFGIEGQLIIPEGQAENVLRLPQNVLVVSQPNPGTPHVIPTHFETTAWNHEPHALFHVPLEERPIQLVVDRYYPDAVVEEVVSDDGETENPAVRLALRHEAQEESLWLLARDPERFGVRWGEVHVLFLEPSTDAQLAQLTKLIDPHGGAGADARVLRASARGTVTITLPVRAEPYEIAVPETMGRTVPLDGSPYVVTFKEYFADLVISEDGLVNRSEEPNNPAVAFTLRGPEGTDAHLLFALHPDFPSLHARRNAIDAEVAYRHPVASELPPDAIVILRRPGGDGALLAVMTDAAGGQQPIEPLTLQTTYTHPGLGYEFEITQYYLRAALSRRFVNRGDEVRAEAVHLMVEDGTHAGDAWVRLHESAHVPLGEHTVHVEYRPAQRELPFTIKLLDFRKIDYPGTQMAAGFESDVQLSDPQRGMILMRQISMNNPLKYRGYSFFQSSYIPGAVETTVLSVRNDPGTPFVYAGFIIVVLGVVLMFALRKRLGAPPQRQGGP